MQALREASGPRPQGGWEGLPGVSVEPDGVKLLRFTKWTAVPRVDAATEASRLRDLEIGSEVRKILARTLFRMLGELCQRDVDGVAKAQPFFVIVCATRRRHSENWGVGHEAAAEDDGPCMFLCPDCSKGYTCMGQALLGACAALACRAKHCEVAIATFARLTFEWRQALIIGRCRFVM